LTPEQFEIAIDNVVADLQSGAFGEVMFAAANDALGLIKTRVVYSGENAEGQQFAPYSTKPLWTGRPRMTEKAYDKVAGSKKKRRELRWATFNKGRHFLLVGGYKEFRELHERQTAFVDFTFHGDMWSSIKIISDKTRHDSGEAIIAPDNQTDFAKLEGNVARRGDILMLNASEIEHVSKIINEGLIDIWKRNGLYE